MGERLFKNSRLFDIIELDKLEFVEMIRWSILQM